MAVCFEVILLRELEQAQEYMYWTIW